MSKHVTSLLELSVFVAVIAFLIGSDTEALQRLVLHTRNVLLCGRSTKWHVCCFSTKDSYAN